MLLIIWTIAKFQRLRLLSPMLFRLPIEHRGVILSFQYAPVCFYHWSCVHARACAYGQQAINIQHKVYSERAHETQHIALRDRWTWLMEMPLYAIVCDKMRFSPTVKADHVSIIERDNRTTFAVYTVFRSYLFVARKTFKYSIWCTLQQEEITFL